MGKLFPITCMMFQILAPFQYMARHSIILKFQDVLVARFQAGRGWSIPYFRFFLLQNEIELNAYTYGNCRQVCVWAMVLN